MNDLKIPVGISDFTKIRENGYYYIDKTGPDFKSCWSRNRRR